jgi:hypothetical protein
MGEIYVVAYATANNLRGRAINATCKRFVVRVFSIKSSEFHSLAKQISEYKLDNMERISETDLKTSIIKPLHACKMGNEVSHCNGKTSIPFKGMVANVLMLTL